jgi:hypothetical protein
MLVVLAAALTVCAAPAAALAAGAAVPDAAHKAAFDAKWLLVQNRLDEAIDQLDMALRLAPGYAAAQEMLADARARRARAQARFDAAAAHAKASRWDDALAELEAAFAIYPSYPQARALEADVHRKAADSLASAGRTHLDAGRLAAAEDAFRAAQRHAPDLPAAAAGLADVTARRGEAALARRLWGRAWLWYAEASDLAPGRPELKQAVAAARAQLLQQTTLTLGPDAPGKDAPSAATAALRSAVWQKARQIAPEFVRIVGGPGPAGPPDFTAALEVTALDVGGERQRIENRTHTYTTEVREPNPEVDRLRILLDSAVARMEAVRAEWRRPCLVCRGGGLTVCRTCGGTGLTGGGPCVMCNRPGGRPGWVVCMRCGGTGRWSGISEGDLRRAEFEVSRLQSQLARTPATVLRRTTAEYPYTVEFHERTGTLEASLRVTSSRTGEAVASDAVRQHREFQDTTVQNPNPAIGVPADPLQLPAEEAVRRTLVDDAAAEAAGKVLGAAIDARAAALQVESLALFAEGKVDEAAELGIMSAFLLQSVRPQEALLQMKRLRDRLRLEDTRSAPPPGTDVPPPPAGPPTP